jgi:hypothetical protein
METDVQAGQLVSVLADPALLPQWAPSFADQVTGDSGVGWQVTKDGRQFTLRVVANREAKTVDYLREVAPGREGGAFIRVVPRPGGGSVVIMTLPLLPETDSADTAATLARELAALVALAKGL